MTSGSSWSSAMSVAAPLSTVPRGTATLRPVGCNIGALIIRIGFWVYYTMIIIRNPPKPILTIKAPTLGLQVFSVLDLCRYREFMGQQPGASLQTVAICRTAVCGQLVHRASYRLAMCVSILDRLSRLLRAMYTGSIAVSVSGSGADLWRST